MSPWIKVIRAVVPFYLLVFALLNIGWANASSPESVNQTGFLVVAADRGFVGNEEIRDAFEPFAANHPAALVFVTDERTQGTLKSGLNLLHDQGVSRIVVLPLFISEAEPRYQLIHQLIIEENQPVPAVFARPYGESYFAVEAIATRLRAIKDTARQNLLVVGYGAQDDPGRQAMYDDWMRITKQASKGSEFRSVNSLILLDRKEDETPENYADNIKQQLSGALASSGSASRKGKSQVIAFGFNPKHDSMMSLESQLKRLLPQDVAFDSFQIEPPLLSMWMEREANRVLPLAAENTGIILFAHGSDFHWNENLRVAVKPLMDRYKIEFAFSMADPLTIERALHKLEQRGAKTAVVVSAYATNSSFRPQIEYLTGIDIEDRSPDQKTSKKSKNGGHGSHGGSSKPVPRILTSLPVIWTGGYEDNPLFATALFDRALELSKDPAKETVILTAHGTNDDQRNDQWLHNLESIANHMRQNGGKKFKAIKVATWREDWPDKREPWIKKIRAMVTEANKQGGKAIIIPARTTAAGPAKKFLPGIEFELGEGFAPHPLFTQWVDEKIQLGMKQHMESARH